MTRVVKELARVAVDRGGGGVSWGIDRVATCRPRSAEGGGRGGRRWPPGAGLAEVVLLAAEAGQRQERARARGGLPEEARAVAVGARRAWGSGRRGRTSWVPVGARPASGGRVCGSGEDGGGGRAREDGGRVRAAAGARQAGGGWGVAAGVEAVPRRAGRGGADLSQVRERGGHGRAGIFVFV
jgi:hypothetical protein